MDEKLSKLKEQISKIDNLKNVAKWGPEYQLWMSKTEKLVGEVFGQEGLKLFQQQQTTTTSYIDDDFNVQQYMKELNNRKKYWKGFLPKWRNINPNLKLMIKIQKQM